MEGWYCLKLFMVMMSFSYGPICVAGLSGADACDQQMVFTCPTVVTVDGMVVQQVIKSDPRLLKNFQLPEDAKGIQNYVCTRPACSSDPCKHDSTCTASADGYSCDCLDGFTGTTCQTDRHLTSAHLFGGNSSSGEGRVGFITKAYNNLLVYMATYSWTMAISHKACQELGFVGAAATLSGNVFPGSYALEEDPKHGEIHCPPNSGSLSELCWYSGIVNRNVSIEWLVAVKCCKPSKCSTPGHPLGIESGGILDEDITSSSGNAQDGRLNSVTSWFALSGDQANPYIQVHLRAYHVITGVVTQGGTDSWLTSFKLSSGSNEGSLEAYADVLTGTEIVFPGNYNATSHVMTTLAPYILAKYIRIHPTTSHNNVSMRFELIGYGPLPDYIDDIHERDSTCLSDVGMPLGVENGTIEDQFLTASSHETGHPPSDGRLNIPTQDGWIPTIADAEPYFQVDLSVEYRVTGVITQGHRTLNQWTTSVMLSIQGTDDQWVYLYDNECDSRQIYPTNYDNNSPVNVRLAEPVEAKGVRIHPQSWEGQITLRCEILGHRNMDPQ